MSVTPDFRHRALAPDFRHRVLAPELMDTEACTPETFRDCLVDLATVNRLTLATAPTLAFLRRAMRRAPPGRPLRIVDVGGGYGDALRVIDAWARRRRISVALVSVDLNPHARAAGQAATRPGRPIEWVTANLFDYRPAGPVDLVISSLFAHHLDDDEVVRFLGWMEATARLGWFVNDLHRHRVPWHAFRAWSRLAGWHRFVAHDGPVSIARAFTRADWEDLVARAGLDANSVEIAWRAPFRLCVGRLR